MDSVAFGQRGVPMPFGSSSCAAAYSGERLRSDENEASVVNARTSVVSIACDLLNKLAIRLEDLFVSASEVYAVGKISQRLVAYPARSSPSRWNPRLILCAARLPSSSPGNGEQT